MNADVHTLAGAYALDALPPDEAAAFAEHLQQCPACQQETAELQITAARLGLAVTQAPPVALRERVLAAVAQTRQIPPAPPRLATQRRRQAWRRLLAAAAVLAVIVGAALFAVLDDTTQPARPDPVAAVVNAPDAHTATVGLRGGGTMTVITSERREQAVVLGQDLPPIRTDLVYQLWLVDPQGAARSADVLIDSSAPTSRPARLIRGLRSGDQIAITREPLGGSRQPTMAPLAIT